LLAAALDFNGVTRSQVRGAAEPASEHGFPAKAASLARQYDKDGLSYFLGQMRIAYLAQGGRVDQRHITMDELRERGLGLAGGKFGKQGGVAG